MATFWALPSILVSVPHQSEKAPTLSASATLCLAASSTCSGLLEASAGLASALQPVEESLLRRVLLLARRVEAAGEGEDCAAEEE